MEGISTVLPPPRASGSLAGRWKSLWKSKRLFLYPPAWLCTRKQTQPVLSLQTI